MKLMWPYWIWDVRTAKFVLITGTQFNSRYEGKILRDSKILSQNPYHIVPNTFMFNNTVKTVRVILNPNYVQDWTLWDGWKVEKVNLMAWQNSLKVLTKTFRGYMIRKSSE